MYEILSTLLLEVNYFVFDTVWIFEIIAETFSNGCKLPSILHSIKERKCSVNVIYLETNETTVLSSNCMNNSRLRQILLTTIMHINGKLFVR
jgi:hypothetical protein